jgi:hypothetical protein
MTIDGSQQVGVGVTPSAWLSNRRAVEVGGGAAAVLALNGTAAVAEIFTNSYRNAAGTYIYSQTGYAGYMNYNNQAGGGWAWSLAPSGTAGTTATFTQAMTLDASGNLRINGSTAALQMATGAERQILAGGSSSATTMTFQRWNGSSYVSDVTMDGSGNFMVGTTSYGVSAAGFGVSAAGRSICAMAASTSAATTLEVYSTGAGAFRFYVDMGGTVHATSVVITAISDERLKENVRDIDTGLSTVMALKPRRYDWKEGKGLDKKNAAGFVAQEFEQVFPDSVGLSKAGEDGIEYKNINYEELIPTLTKAIQEQQAIIQAQAADIAALKAKVGI